jgi:hypothetical protein
MEKIQQCILSLEESCCSTAAVENFVGEVVDDASTFPSYSCRNCVNNDEHTIMEDGQLFALDLR